MLVLVGGTLMVIMTSSHTMKLEQCVGEGLRVLENLKPEQQLKDNMYGVFVFVFFNFF